MERLSVALLRLLDRLDSLFYALPLLLLPAPRRLAAGGLLLALLGAGLFGQP
jgi:hypothetical protein